MSDEKTIGGEGEIADLPAQGADQVRGGKKGSFDITEADAAQVSGRAGAGKVSVNDVSIAGDPSQWGVASLNYSKIEL